MTDAGFSILNKRQEWMVSKGIQEDWEDQRRANRQANKRAEHK